MSSSLRKRIGISIIAQVVSLLISFLLNMIVPKFIDEYQYAYWQTFLLYVNYVGVLCFGLLDGIMLRYSQYDYDELDKSLIKSQLGILLLGLTTFSFAAFIIAGTTNDEMTRAILCLVAIGILSKNVFTFMSYTFQMTNRIRNYALLVILQRVSYGFFVIILLVFGVNNYIFYCIADLLGDAVGIVVGIIMNKEIMLSPKATTFKQALQESFNNIKAGMNVMLAIWFSILLVSCAKMIVQWRWDDITFGKVSFAFSTTNLFLSFVSAISIVIFPSLKRMSIEKLPDFYNSARQLLTPTLFAALVFYYPLCFAIKLWLPKYEVSLVYFGIILPMVCYSSRISILTDNYLKSYRLEKKLLRINFASFLVAIFGFTVCAYIWNNIKMLLLWIVVAMAFRAIYSEIVVASIIRVDIKRNIAIDLCFTIIFEFVVNIFDAWVAFIAYLCAVIIYITSMRAIIVKAYKDLRRM